MPKEVIQWPGTEGSSGTEISIHWNKDLGWVQLAATRHVWIPDGLGDPHNQQVLCRNTHADHNNCSECVYDAPPPKQYKAWGSTAEEPERGDRECPSTVWSEPLTRNEINDMIRVLRRARDAAHGQDA